jgi:hypothetical protein
MFTYRVRKSRRLSKDIGVLQIVHLVFVGSIPPGIKEVLYDIFPSSGSRPLKGVCIFFLRELFRFPLKGDLPKHHKLIIMYLWEGCPIPIGAFVKCS